MSWRDKLYKVLFIKGDREGQVARMVWAEADKLREEGAARFISNTVYKAVKAGIDITKETDEKKLKKLIAEVMEKRRKAKEKQEKSEKKKQRKRRGKPDAGEALEREEAVA